MKNSDNIKFIIVLLFPLILICSCSKFPSDVENALKEAGSNRPEMEKVLNHYLSSDEELKFRAACFLISNMKDKYSIYSKSNEKIYLAFNEKKDWYKDNKSSRNQFAMKLEIDSLIQNNRLAPEVNYDLNILSADYLISNIDYAFKAWEEPWANHFSFEEFCEYILPYRIENEPLSNWRSTFYDKYIWVKDSVKNVRNTEEIALYINDLVSKEFLNENFLGLPNISVTNLEQVKAGVCNQRYILMTCILRAIGVPSVIDYAPQNNSSFKGHSWTVYLDTLHNLRPFDGGAIKKKLNQNDKPDKAFPDRPILPLADGFGSNVFRHNFSVNQKALASNTEDLSTIPLLFRSTNLKNVTNEYEFPQQTINYPVPSQIAKKNDVAYLAVFGYGQTLHAADWCYIKNGVAKFGNIGTGIVYLVCTYKNGELVPFSNPILLKDSINSIVLEPNLDSLHNVILTRKCKISFEMQEFAELMVGNLFQGSDIENFDSPKTFFEIDEAPEFLVKQHVPPNTKFRYVRFYSPHNDIHVAEIQLWGLNEAGETVKLKGRPLWHISNDSMPEVQPLFALDDSIQTNFNAPAKSWVGYDLGKLRQIKTVGYLARNNFNIINSGNDYELLYYNNGWHSLGIKNTENQYLEYNNVPSQALFILKNLTRGREERIFTYEDNKQVWW
jgi:hypothetical protein